MFNGLIFYFHWDAELISYLAKVVIPMPFSNMAELYESDYQFTTLGESAFSDSFKNGNELWQKYTETSWKLGINIVLLNEIVLIGCFLTQRMLFTSATIF